MNCAQFARPLLHYDAPSGCKTCIVQFVLVLMMGIFSMLLGTTVMDVPSSINYRTRAVN